MIRAAHWFKKGTSVLLGDLKDARWIISKGFLFGLTSVQ